MGILPGRDFCCLLGGIGAWYEDLWFLRPNDVQLANNELHRAPIIMKLLLANAVVDALLKIVLGDLWRQAIKALDPVMLISLSTCLP